MRYFVSVMQYLFSKQSIKKCLLLLAFAIIPAMLLAAALPVFKLFTFIHETQSVPFGILWLSYFDHWHIVFLLLAVLLTVSLSSSCISYSLTYHMKIGQFGLPRFFTAFNNNFLYCLIRSAYVGVALIIHYSLFILLDSLWNAVLVPLAAIIASAITYGLICLLFAYIASGISTWLPFMTVAGRSPSDALISSYSLMKKSGREFFLFYFVIAAMVTAFATAAYFMPKWWLSLIITAISYALILIFVHVYWFIAFFKENNIQRADLIVSSFKRRI